MIDHQRAICAVTLSRFTGEKDRVFRLKIFFWRLANMASEDFRYGISKKRIGAYF